MTDRAGQRNRTAALRWLSLVVAVLSLPLLAAWVQFTVGWGAVLAPWRELPAATLGACLGLMAASYGLRALRLHDYFHARVGHAPLATLRLTLQHNLANNLLPMRTGEAAFPLLMKRYFGERYSTSAASLLWLRVLDLLALAGVSAAVVAGTGAGGGVASGPMLAAIGAGTIAVLTALPALRPAGQRLRARPGRLRAVAGEILGGLPASAGRYWRIVAWSLLSWTAKLTAFLWLAVAFTGLPVAQAMAGVAAGELSSVLPVHGVAGSGTYEGAMVAALVLSGAAHDRALEAAVNVHLFLLGSSLLFGAAARLLPLPAQRAAIG
jgi:hypothetical protein